MGYVFNFNDAVAYEQWLNHARNRYTLELEGQLLLDLLNPMPGETVLDIGCGTGAITGLLVQKGIQATGIDPSPYMLDIAKKNLSHNVDLHRGVAEDLPFEDNTFNHACLVATLEFVEDPLKALEEASRVAKDRLFVGVLNRHALKGMQLRFKGLFIETIYNQARFFSIWEVKQMVRTLLGSVPVTWRTVCQAPGGAGRVNRTIQRVDLLKRCPFGYFVGMVVTLVPRFRTKPLPLCYSTKRRPGVAPG